MPDAFIQIKQLNNIKFNYVSYNVYYMSNNSVVLIIEDNKPI